MKIIVRTQIKKRTSRCQGDPECKCHRTQQTLDAEKDKRIEVEGDDRDSYPQKLKFFVHATNDWYCSSATCGHPISQHMNEPIPRQSSKTQRLEELIFAGDDNDDCFDVASHGTDAINFRQLILQQE